MYKLIEVAKSIVTKLAFTSCGESSKHLSLEATNLKSIEVISVQLTMTIRFEFLRNLTKVYKDSKFSIKPTLGDRLKGS